MHKGRHNNVIVLSKYYTWISVDSEMSLHLIIRRYIVATDLSTSVNTAVVDSPEFSDSQMKKNSEPRISKQTTTARYQRNSIY